MNKKKLNYYLQQLKYLSKNVSFGKKIIDADTFIDILDFILEEPELPISYYILPNKNPCETITMNS